MYTPDVKWTTFSKASERTGMELAWVPGVMCTINDLPSWSKAVSKFFQFTMGSTVEGSRDHEICR